MNSIFSVMLGGAIGSGLRYLCGVVFNGRLPWGTLGVNLLGGFAMGLLAALLLKSQVGEGARLFVGVGILGGFTTFSTFSLDCWTMIDRGETGLALGYALVSVAGSVLLLIAGMAAGRALA